MVNGQDYSVTPRLVRDGCCEPASERFVAKTVQGGDWFVDVGANIGLFSLLAAGKCGPFGRVFAFEPNPSVADLLMESAALNWCHDRIVVKRIALSDFTGKMRLHIPENRTGDVRILRDDAAIETEAGSAAARTSRFLPDETVIEVETDTLDALFPLDLPIKILKIDAEGHEANVLSGAKRLLSAKAFDYIMIEAIVDVGIQKWAKTRSWLMKLMELGYRVCTPNEDGSLARCELAGQALSQMKDNNLIFEATRS